MSDFFPKKRWEVAKLFLRDKLDKMVTPPGEKYIQENTSSEKDISQKLDKPGYPCWVKTIKGDWIKGIYTTQIPATLYYADRCDVIKDAECIFLVH